MSNPIPVKHREKFVAFVDDYMSDFEYTEPADWEDYLEDACDEYLTQAKFNHGDPYSAATQYKRLKGMT